MLSTCQRTSPARCHAAAATSTMPYLAEGRKVKWRSTLIYYAIHLSVQSAKNPGKYKKIWSDAEWG